jgi:hypothetical protein
MICVPKELELRPFTNAVPANPYVTISDNHGHHRSTCLQID